MHHVYYFSITVEPEDGLWLAKTCRYINCIKIWKSCDWKLC